MPLPDSDPRKWGYALHTRAKHEVLRRYIAAWLPILARRTRAIGESANLTMVDGFAGRGRYEDGSDGSPVIFHRAAADAVQRCTVSELDLYLIEANRDNYDNLVDVLDKQRKQRDLSVHPIHSEFAAAAPAIIAQLHENPRPSFWFIDPFGFAGIPMELIGEILSMPQAEVFVTFMTRDINRFVGSANHRQAIGSLLGLDDDELDEAIAEIESAGEGERVNTLRLIYERQIKQAGGAVFSWSFRVDSDDKHESLYYMIHASTHIKAFREMKDATKDATDGLFAFLGPSDFPARMQSALFDLDAWELPTRLQERFRGMDLAFDDLCDLAYPDSDYFKFTEPDFRRALNQLAEEGPIEKIPVDSATARGLKGKDRLIFPSPPLPRRADAPVREPAPKQRTLFG